MKGANIIELDTPMEVNCIDWGYAHPNCNALFLEVENPSNMEIIAYAVNEEGNNELQQMKGQNRNYKLFVGVDGSLLNFVGEMR